MRISRTVVLMLAVSLLVAGSVSIAVAEPPDSITWAYIRDASGLDPLQWSGSPSSMIADNIYDTLVEFKRGPDQKTVGLQPGLAKSWDITEGGTVYTFHLRKGVQFHKGWGEMTAEDVKFSFERHMDPENASRFRGNVAHIKEVKALDKYTVQFTLKNPHPSFLAMSIAYSQGNVLSKDAMAEIGKKEYNTTNPIGTGPYQFKNRTFGESLTCVLNEDYWGWEEGKQPEIKEWTMVVIPEETQAARALLTGDIDYMAVRTNEAKALLEAAPEGKVLISTNVDLGWAFQNNLDDGRVLGGDAKLRQALLFALDRESIVDRVLMGVTEVSGQSPLAPYHGKYYNEDVMSYSYDPEKAKSLLDEAGYVDANDDGFRETPDGEELNLEVLTYAQHLPWVIASQNMWKEVGINSYLNVADYATLHEKVMNRQFDMFTTCMTRPIPALLWPRYHSENIPAPNMMGYRNPRVDELIDTFMSTPETEEEKLLEIAHELQEIIAEELPVLRVPGYFSTTASTSKLKGDSHNVGFWAMDFDQMYWED